MTLACNPSTWEDGGVEASLGSEKEPKRIHDSPVLVTLDDLLGGPHHFHPLGEPNLIEAKLLSPPPTISFPFFVEEVLQNVGY